MIGATEVLLTGFVALCIQNDLLEASPHFKISVKFKHSVR